MQNSLFVSADEKVAWDVLPLSSPRFCSAVDEATPTKSVSTSPVVYSLPHSLSLALALSQTHTYTALSGADESSQLQM